MADDPPTKKPQPVGGAKSALDRLEQHAADRLGSGSRKEPEGDGRRSGASNLRRFAGMGFEFFAVILVFGLIGSWLDDKFQWHGVATVVAVCVATIGDLYLQIKVLLKDDKRAPRSKRNNRSGN